jgi:nucleoid-associated protein YgaU
MTERGLPTVDGPVACPFVAFVDDRDERATSPDHRHRCYAEATPAPRALAHQEAYCLASAFPVCPTFQDWARREAARTRAESPTTAGQPIPGLSDERPSGDEEDEPVYEDRPPRNARRNWAAPPPWMNRSEQTGGASGPADEEDLGDQSPDSAYGGSAAAGAGAAAGGLSGSFADRMVTPTEPGRQRTPVWRDNHDRWDDEGGEGREEESPNERSEARPGRDAGAAAAAAAGAGAAAVAAGSDDVDVEDAPPVRRTRDRGQGPVRDRDDSGRHDVGPSWERPARLETFPSLRAQRMASLNVPTLVLAAVAVVLAAILLFFLPGFLGLGSGGGSSPTPTPAATQPVASQAAATLQPVATQQTYVVQSGDTMSKIAKRFGVPLQTLVDANKTTVPDPNKLKIGDTLIIPVVSPSTVPAASP